MILASTITHNGMLRLHAHSGDIPNEVDGETLAGDFEITFEKSGATVWNHLGHHVSLDKAQQVYTAMLTFGVLNQEE